MRVRKFTHLPLFKEIRERRDKVTSQDREGSKWVVSSRREVKIWNQGLTKIGIVNLHDLQFYVVMTCQLSVTWGRQGGKVGKKKRVGK